MDRQYGRCGLLLGQRSRKATLPTSIGISVKAKSKKKISWLRAGFLTFYFKLVLLDQQQGKGER
jgi:hypothetical protein